MTHLLSCDMSTSHRGRNCLHMLAASAKDNASALYHLLKSVVPNFPINKQDADGNTGTCQHCVNISNR